MMAILFNLNCLSFLCLVVNILLLISRGQSVLIHLAVLPSFVHHLKSLQAEVEQTKAVKHCQSTNNTIALLDQHFEKF